LVSACFLMAEGKMTIFLRSSALQASISSRSAGISSRVAERNNGPWCSMAERVLVATKARIKYKNFMVSFALQIKIILIQDDYGKSERDRIKIIGAKAMVKQKCSKKKGLQRKVE
jgi:hypothetical protein